MAKASLPPFVVIVDSREQRPFPMLGFATIRKKLDAGDYSIQGLEHRLSVERKSYDDIWGSMSLGRGRFEKCVKKLAQLERAAIVIECGLTQLATQHPRIERTNVASVVGGLISWSCQYRLPVFWTDTREQAERVTIRFLSAFYKHLRGEDNGMLSG